MRKLAKYGNRDLFERLIANRVLDAPLIASQTKAIENYLSIHYATKDSNIHLSLFKRYICGYGTEDQGLPFLYFAAT